MTAAGLEVLDLSRRYGYRQILSGLTFAVRTGEFIAIMGESGSGKSTLLNLIAGLETPDSGTIRIDGVELGALDDDARTCLRRAKVGFVFQSFHILPHLTVAQNVELPLVLLGVSVANRRTRTSEMLRAVGLADRHASAPRELSGGELQRVAVARALAHRPALLLADEPTGNLHSDQGKEIMELFRRLNEGGTTIVQVTHSKENASYGKRVINLKDGWIVDAN